MIMVNFRLTGLPSRWRIVPGPAYLPRFNGLGFYGKVARRKKRSKDVEIAPARVETAPQFLDLAGFEKAALVPEPFPHLIVPGFIPPAAQTAIARDYPKIAEPGSFPPADLEYGPAFADFIAELEGPAMRAAFARKFAIDLSTRPTMITVRGQARAADGRIHRDSATKLITVLIYMNESWEARGGRLRLLRSDASLEDAVAEVPPAAGTLLGFRVTPHSWHGHAPVSGPRRVVQLNWVESERVVRRERLRHGLSARMKRLMRRLSAFSPQPSAKLTADG
jgi:SM-20-related protein